MAKISSRTISQLFLTQWASPQQRNSKSRTKILVIRSNLPRTGINGGLNIFNLISAIAGAFLADKIGRRPLWMSSFIGMIIIGIPFTVLSAGMNEST